MGTKLIEINELIEINDTEIGLQKLPSILNTAIVTPKYSTSYMDKHSGALEIKMGNCIYVIPEMMVIDDKQRFIVQVNPPRLIRFREYRRGFQTPHELSFMPATLGRNGFLTTDTTQTQ